MRLIKMCMCRLWCKTTEQKPEEDMAVYSMGKHKRKSYTFLTTFIEKSHWKYQSALSDVSLSFLCACSSIERFNHIYIAIALYADGNVKNWKGLCFVYRIGTNTLACVFASTHIQPRTHTNTRMIQWGCGFIYSAFVCTMYTPQWHRLLFTISAEIHCLFFIKCRKCNSTPPIHMHTEERSTTVWL